MSAIITFSGFPSGLPLPEARNHVSLALTSWNISTDFTFALVKSENGDPVLFTHDMKTADRIYGQMASTTIRGTNITIQASSKNHSPTSPFTGQFHTSPPSARSTEPQGTPSTIGSTLLPL